MKIGPVVLEIFGACRFSPSRPKMCSCYSSNLGLLDRSWPNLHMMLLCNIAIEYFWIGTAIFLPFSKRQPAEWRLFCQFCPKLVAMAVSRKKKESRSIIYEQIHISLWKDCENRSSGYEIICLRAIIKKEKKKVGLSQAKYIALPSSLPSGLNNSFISSRNLVNFRPPTLEFTMLKCIQETSIDHYSG